VPGRKLWHLKAHGYGNLAFGTYPLRVEEWVTSGWTVIQAIRSANVDRENGGVECHIFSQRVRMSTE
jgi:hypothetical protein